MEFEAKNCPYHEWGEEDFDWAALSQAGELIYNRCRKARLGIHWKEKYGTLRVSPWPFSGMLHSLIWPGYVYNQYKWKWMWRVDCFLAHKIMPLWPFRHLHNFIVRKQVQVLADAYTEAVQKFPHIKDEILDDCPVNDYR